MKLPVLNCCSSFIYLTLKNCTVNLVPHLLQISQYCLGTDLFTASNDTIRMITVTRNCWNAHMNMWVLVWEQLWEKVILWRATREQSCTSDECFCAACTCCWAPCAAERYTSWTMVSLQYWLMSFITHFLWQKNGIDICSKVLFFRWKKKK